MQNIILDNGKKYEMSGGLATTCSGINGHYFLWAGDPRTTLPEGSPCACGTMLWHTEKCHFCGSIVSKPIER